MLTDFLKDIKDLTGVRKKVMDLLGCLSHIFSKNLEYKQRLRSVEKSW